jgi:purine-binding chemotaxis protein CheW
MKHFVPPASPPSAPAASNKTQEFLAFQLDGQEYGIEILRVQEIRSFDPPLRIANAPAHLLGMLNLRGVIVPIIDLRLHFGQPDPSYDALTVVIVVQCEGRTLGVVVDAVSDVIALTGEQLRDLPAFSAAVPNDHLLAIGTLDDRTFTLLDIDRLLANPSIGLAHGAAVH